MAGQSNRPNNRQSWVPLRPTFEALEPRSLLSATPQISFEDGIVRVDGSDQYNQLVVEPYTSYKYAPDGDHPGIPVITQTWHLLNVSLIARDAKGVLSGEIVGNWITEDIKQIIVDNSSAHSAVTIKAGDGRGLPALIELVGDRSSYSVFRISDAQFDADLLSGFDSDAKSLDGNAEDLLMKAPAPVSSTTNAASSPIGSESVPSGDSAAPPASIAMPVFSTQPVASTAGKDDDAVWT